jgi:hypothetical protein
METPDENKLHNSVPVSSHKRRPSGRITSTTNSPEYTQGCDAHQKARAVRDEILATDSESEPRRVGNITLSKNEISRRGGKIAAALSNPNSQSKAVADIRKTIQFLDQEKLGEAYHPTNGRFQYYDKGSESAVFINPEKTAVHKFTPIIEMVLDIPLIKGNQPIYAKHCAHPLCDQFGEISVFQRNEIFAILPGVASTTIHAISQTGHIITEQRYLGKEEPTMEELHQWAVKHGYIILPPQEDDPEKVEGTDIPVTEGASSAMPLLFPHDDAVFLLVDIVPRNARRVANGNIEVFDVTTRPLRKEEIEKNQTLEHALK